MSRFKISRRQLLGVAATTAVAGLALGREGSVAGPVANGAGTPDPQRSSGGAHGSRTLAWLDGMLSSEDLTHARETLAPLQPRILEPDLLWQWRRELAEELGKGVRAVAITRWDKAFVLSGLAREVALPVRQTRLGRSLFQTEIG
jgi:hypothetical protein